MLINTVVINGPNHFSFIFFVFPSDSHSISTMVHFSMSFPNTNESCVQNSLGLKIVIAIPHTSNQGTHVLANKFKDINLKTLV